MNDSIKKVIESLLGVIKNIPVGDALVKAKDIIANLLSVIWEKVKEVPFSSILTTIKEKVKAAVLWVKEKVKALVAWVKSKISK